MITHIEMDTGLKVLYPIVVTEVKELFQYSDLALECAQTMPLVFTQHEVVAFGFRLRFIWISGRIC